MCSIDVVKNYNEIKNRVKAACERVGRNPEEVTIIAVSKTKPDWMVGKLSAAGVRDFGENKPQELMRKHDELIYGEDGVNAISRFEGEARQEQILRWHMIGNIQTNKVKMFVGRAALIHSVPDMHVAGAISAQAVKCGVTAHILIEVNIAGEETKHGFIGEEADLASDLEALIREIQTLPNLSIDGLMAICPPVDDPEKNRKYFQSLRLLRDSLKNSTGAPLTHLSMGMTGDFEVAVEEGATYIRVGTAIFGARDYSK